MSLGGNSRKYRRAEKRERYYKRHPEKRNRRQHLKFNGNLDMY